MRDPKDGKAYDLAPLLDPGFTFTRSLDSGIGDVQMRKMRLTRRCRTGRHLTLQAANTAALHAMLNEVCQSVRLADYELTQVELRAQVSELVWIGTGVNCPAASTCSGLSTVKMISETSLWKSSIVLRM